MVPLGESAKDETPSDKLQPSEASDNETRASKETSTNGPDRQEKLPSIKTEKTKPVPDSSGDVSQSNLGGKASPKRPKKALKVPETGDLAFQSGQEVSTPSSIREKVSEDGFNWRKYGQKLVKGNEYVRSYYRCTYPNCLVKKQLERLHEGKIVDIVYFGQHSHPKPQVNIPVAVGFAVSVFEDRRKEPSSSSAEDSVAHVHEKSPRTPQTKPVDISRISNVSANDSSKGTVSQSSKKKDEIFSDDDPDSKRQKRDKDNLKNTLVDKSASDPRLVVQTRSEVDIVNDGFRWRKYGQKLVKGNPNPRSYYRCSNSGCPVKKHVERASHDPKVVITTYEGQHSHDAPPSRIVTHNVSGSSSSPTAPNGESGTKSDGNATCLDMVVDVIIEHESNSEQPLSSEFPSRLGENNNTKCSKLTESRSGPENKPEKRKNSKLVVKEERDSVSSVPVESRTNNNLDSQPSIKSEGNNSCVVDMAVHDNIKSEVQNPDSEPVQG